MGIKSRSIERSPARKPAPDGPRAASGGPAGAALAPPRSGIDFIDRGATRSGKRLAGDGIDAVVAGKSAVDAPPTLAVAGGRPDGGAPKLRARLQRVPAAGPAATGKVGYQEVSAPAGTTQGSFKWVVQWVLDAPSAKGGWVVQKVSAEFDVKDSAGKKVDVKSVGVDPAWWPMSEAWPVNAGQSVTTYAQGGDLEDDTYAMPHFGAGTKGTLRIKGLAQFHEGVALPGAFKVTNSAPAWILPYAKGSPAVAGGTGVINHSITAQWDDTSAKPATRTFVA